MSTIEDLERQILQLKKEMQANGQNLQKLTQKSEKALDAALHAYKVDHYGIIWAWDTELQGYRKTQMRVCSPEIPNEAVTTKKMADGAITGDKIAAEAVTGDKIAPAAVKGKHIALHSLTAEQIAPGAITHEKLAPECITGDDLDSDIPNGKLANDAVSTRNIQKGAVLPEKLDPELLDLILSAGTHGIAVANEFGDNKLISVSQKKLTDAFVKVWQKLEDITGESLQGITMAVTPDYFIGEDGADIHVTANTVEANGIFEQIRFLINGAEVYSAENVDTLEYDAHIDETSVIKCEAKIMGVWYERQNIITHYNSFWLGAGTTYTDIMDVEHCIPITNGMRGAYDVSVADGDHLFIVVGGSLAQGFLRADMNSIEIPFTESTVEIDGETYKVYTSINTYNAGTYNIDING